MYLSGFLCFLGALPLFLKIFGLEFLSAPEAFLALPRWVPWIAGGLVCLPSLYSFSGAPLVAYFVYGEDFWRYAGRFFIGILLFVVTLFSTKAFFEVTMPMVHTAIKGTSGEIEYRITSPYTNSARCRGGFDVNTDAGFLYNSLCGLSWRDRPRSMREGVIIRVQGRASSAGVYPRSFSLGRSGEKPD